MSYVETLYGHQDTVVALDSLDRERALSCGARDRSLRLWKIVEETQLAFEGNQMLGSIDCMTMITESAFVSGSQDGTLNVSLVHFVHSYVFPCFLIEYVRLETIVGRL